MRPSAEPQVDIKGETGDPVVLKIDGLEGRCHLPVIHTRLAAKLGSVRVCISPLPVCAKSFFTSVLSEALAFAIVIPSRRHRFFALSPSTSFSRACPSTAHLTCLTGKALPPAFA